MDSDLWTQERLSMVEKQVQERGIQDPKVLSVLRCIPRHRFVPEGIREESYRDKALPIEDSQTISQPFIVAAMTEHLHLKGHERCLEIGTGSGYQTAILAELALEVYTVETIPKLAEKAKDVLLNQLKYRNIFFRTGDGSHGWPEHAPFDAIMVTAAPPHVPPALFNQLKMGGRMVIPLGPAPDKQELSCFTKTNTGIEKRVLFPVRFVPLIRSR
ncbi:MAG: protein-L-isoaspartate(D-aspartate) O-methyltransferase [Elusimicrobia bacterium]|nr:protein-L-isoaspartate(D-aspartate) O-methyltransferase [Elusimicrobiota bacterium]